MYVLYSSSVHCVRRPLVDTNLGDLHVNAIVRENSGLTEVVSHGNTGYRVFPLPDVSDPKFASIS